MKKRTLILASALAVVGSGLANAQSSTVLITGLNAPMKLAMTAEGNLLVSESTVSFNTGRISIVDRGGARRSLIEGLPCGPAFPGGAPLGPGAIVVDGRTLYISVLEGNSLVAGPTPTSHPIPNPDGPASPIFSSVLRVRLSADVDRILTTFKLTLDDHFTLADFAEVQSTNADGQTATFQLLADFPDTPLDRREVWGHVTPYGMTLDAAKQFLYIADAGQNRVTRVDVNTGHWNTVLRFPRLDLSPTAQTDPVPTSVHTFGDQLLVTFLSGAPFVQGSAGVRIVDPATKTVNPFIGLLTTSTDLLIRDNGSKLQFWVSEFRHFLVGVPNSGRILEYDSPQGKVIADGLQGPTGMAQDPVTGDIFVAENGGGRISRVRLQ